MPSERAPSRCGKQVSFERKRAKADGKVETTTDGVAANDATNDAASNAAPATASIAGLKELLEGLNLGDKLAEAAAWCVDSGADSVADLEGYEEKLAAALNLPRIKKDKLVKALKAGGAPPATEPPAPAPDPAPAPAPAPAPVTECDRILGKLGGSFKGLLPSLLTGESPPKLGFAAGPPATVVPLPKSDVYGVESPTAPTAPKYDVYGFPIEELKFDPYGFPIMPKPAVKKIHQI